MKGLITLSLLVLAIMATPYDPKNHHNGHELEVSIREDTNTVFVIMWYNSKGNDNVVDYNNKNKTDIASKLSGADDVSFSMIDLGIEAHTDTTKPDEDYSELFATINGEEYADKEDYLKEEGPIVNILRKSAGVRVSGKGISDEVADQVDEMREKIASDNKTASKKAATQQKKAANTVTNGSGSESEEDDNLDKSREPTQGEIDDIF